METPLDAAGGAGSQSQGVGTSSITVEIHLTSYVNHTECDIWTKKEVTFIYHVLLEYLSLNLFQRKSFDETSSLSIHEMQLVCQWQDTHRAIITPHHTHKNTYICTGSCHALRVVHLHK